MDDFATTNQQQQKPRIVQQTSPQGTNFNQNTVNFTGIQPRNVHQIIPPVRYTEEDIQRLRSYATDTNRTRFNTFLTHTLPPFAVAAINPYVHQHVIHPASQLITYNIIHTFPQFGPYENQIRGAVSRLLHSGADPFLVFIAMRRTQYEIERNRQILAQLKALQQNTTLPIDEAKRLEQQLNVDPVEMFVRNYGKEYLKFITAGMIAEGLERTTARLLPSVGRQTFNWYSRIPAGIRSPLHLMAPTPHNLLIGSAFGLTEMGFSFYRGGWGGLQNALASELSYTYDALNRITTLSSPETLPVDIMHVVFGSYAPATAFSLFPGALDFIARGIFREEEFQPRLRLFENYYKDNSNLVLRVRLPYVLGLSNAPLSLSPANLFETLRQFQVLRNVSFEEAFLNLNSPFYIFRRIGENSITVKTGDNRTYSFYLRGIDLLDFYLRDHELSLAFNTRIGPRSASSGFVDSFLSYLAQSPSWPGLDRQIRLLDYDQLRPKQPQLAAIRRGFGLPSEENIADLVDAIELLRPGGDIRLQRVLLSKGNIVYNKFNRNLHDNTVKVILKSIRDELEAYKKNLEDQLKNTTLSGAQRESLEAYYNRVIRTIRLADDLYQKVPRSIYQIGNETNESIGERERKFPETIPRRQITGLGPDSWIDEEWLQDFVLGVSKDNSGNLVLSGVSLIRLIDEASKILSPYNEASWESRVDYLWHKILERNRAERYKANSSLFIEALKNDRVNTTYLAELIKQREELIKELNSGPPNPSLGYRLGLLDTSIADTITRLNARQYADFNLMHMADRQVLYDLFWGNYMQAVKEPITDQELSANAIVKIGQRSSKFNYDYLRLAAVRYTINRVNAGQTGEFRGDFSEENLNILTLGRFLRRIFMETSFHAGSEGEKTLYDLLLQYNEMEKQYVRLSLEKKAIESSGKALRGERLKDIDEQLRELEDNMQRINMITTNVVRSHLAEPLMRTLIEEHRVNFGNDKARQEAIEELTERLYELMLYSLKPNIEPETGRYAVGSTYDRLQSFSRDITFGYRVAPAQLLDAMKSTFNSDWDTSRKEIIETHYTSISNPNSQTINDYINGAFARALLHGLFSDNDEINSSARAMPRLILSIFDKDGKQRAFDFSSIMLLGDTEEGMSFIRSLGIPPENVRSVRFLLEQARQLSFGRSRGNIKEFLEKSNRLFQPTSLLAYAPRIYMSETNDAEHVEAAMMNLRNRYLQTQAQLHARVLRSNLPEEIKPFLISTIDSSIELAAHTQYRRELESMMRRAAPENEAARSELERLNLYLNSGEFSINSIISVSHHAHNTFRSLLLVANQLDEKQRREFFNSDLFNDLLRIYIPAMNFLFDKQSEISEQAKKLRRQSLDFRPYDLDYNRNYNWVALESRLALDKNFALAVGEYIELLSTAEHYGNRLLNEHLGLSVGGPVFRLLRSPHSYVGHENIQSLQYLRSELNKQINIINNTNIPDRVRLNAYSALRETYMYTNNAYEATLSIIKDLNEKGRSIEAAYLHYHLMKLDEPQAGTILNGNQATIVSGLTQALFEARMALQGIKNNKKINLQDLIKQGE